MGVYDRQIATATRLIKAKGELVTWVQTVLTKDGTQPWKTTDNSPAPIPVSIVFLSPGSGLANALVHLMKGTDVPEGAPRGLMAGSISFTPKLKDRVNRDGVELEIAGIDTVAPNGQPILYKLTFA